MNMLPLVFEATSSRNEASSHVTLPETVRAAARALKNRPREESDDYPAVVALLNARWRIIEAADAPAQWILQRHAGAREGVPVWRNRSFCQTSQALQSCAREHAGEMTAGAKRVLRTLPDRIIRGAPA
jgi:hypothetical protein